MDVILIGASGLLGSRIIKRFEREGIEITGTHLSSPTKKTSVRIDKRDSEAISELILNNNPEVVIDAGAFHNVDVCEEMKQKAWCVNAEGTKNVAVAADNVDAHLIYLSTDYVFPGHRGQAPYTECDPVNPINYYGQTKYAGEQAAKISGEWTILRSSVLYGDSGDSFLTWARRRLSETGKVNVVDDQINSVTYAADVAEACLQIGKNGITGLFHAAGPEAISRYRFTCRLAETFGYSRQNVYPITSEELGQRATRPRDSSLDSTKLYESIGYSFRDSKKALKELSDRGNTKVD